MNIDKSKKIDSWECPDFDAKDQLTEKIIETFSLSVKLPIVTLMKEIGPVATEKHHLDNRDQSLLVTTFLETLDYQDFDARININ